MPGQNLQQYASSLAMHRLLLYSVFSTGAVMAVIVNALKKYSNFYSVTVYLSRSNGSAIVLANFGVLLALFCGRILQQIFFGPLRSMEVERLYDRIWFFLTESLLAFTIFRDEFGISFALMFGVLLFTKCFHWLLSDRIEWMDQRPYPGPPLLFHIRVNALMAILWISDFCVFLFLVDNMLQDGVGSIVLFASEYAILMATVLNSIAKYGISIVELRRASRRGGENAPPWEDKSMWVFYVELATDFLKLVTYLTFFMLVLKVYGLPLNIVRDVYITARSFIMKARDLMRYRTATRNMDQRYPNATEEEMNAMNDRTCIICREEMFVPSNSAQRLGQASQANGEAQANADADAATSAQRDGPNMTPKKLACGHVFHFYCLRSWLERQQSCPTCRRSVLDNTTPGSGTARQAPAPQPGAAPQNPGINGANRPQAGVIPNQQQQQQGPQQQAPNVGAGANFGGLFGRLMGVAAGVPPIVPGQFAPGPNPGQAAGAPVRMQMQGNGNVVVDANGWVGRHQQQDIPPFVIGQQQFPLAQQQQPQQPRLFQGFYGPGGVWQPWPMAEGDVPIQIQDEHDAPPAPNTASDSQGERVTESTTRAEVHGTEGDSGASTPRSAREAAALAALRRNNSSSTSISKTGAPSSANEKRGEGSQSSETQSQGRSATTSSSTGAENGHAQTLPPLIPLYIPSPANQRATYPSQSMSVSVLPGQRVTISSLPRRSQGLGSSYALPPTLTDEQLGRLDRLTRDAIDERLRVLEDVQRVTARCVEELLRVRSVLPRSSPNPSSGASDGSSTNVENDSSPSPTGTSLTEDETGVHEAPGVANADAPSRTADVSAES